MFNYKDVAGKPQPFVELQIDTKYGRFGIEGLVDSGASHSLFPFEFIDMLGYSLGDGARKDVPLPTGAMAPIIVFPRKKVSAYLGTYAFELSSVFHAELIDDPCILLGRVDFFAAFRVEFDQTQRKFWLTPRS